MIIAFGVIVLAVIGAVAASLAAPLAVVVGGVARARGMRRGGLAAGLLAWVALTTAALVGLFLGMTGDAGHGVDVFGVAVEDLLALAPWAWLLAAVLGIGFRGAGRRGAADKPAS